MPIYEYYCNKCKIKFEFIAPKSEGYEERACPSCKKSAPRKISRPGGFNLKGPGFHANDYPSIDKVIGADSERRWKEIHKRREKRNRKIDMTKYQEGNYTPLPEEAAKQGEKLVSEKKK